LTPETLIYSELDRLGIFYKVQGENFLVKCRWHDDGSPSLSLHKSGSKARCWGCSWTGTWNIFALEVGAELITSENINEAHVILSDLKSSMPRQHTMLHRSPIEKGAGGSSKMIPHSANIMYKEDWRGIPSSFFFFFDARRWYDDEAEAYRILFPVRKFSGKTIGWIAAKEDPSDTSITLKYRNMKGMPISEVLYPIHIHEGDAVVLVEGPFDAIRLRAQGIPALAICGTENWNGRKERMLITSGVTRVFIAMDGDDAGRKAANRIAYWLEDNFDTTIIDLPDGEDPGSVDQYFIDWLKSLLS